MIDDKFIWLSCNHLAWLASLSESPMLIDAPILTQLSEKGIIARGSSDIWEVTPYGEPYRAMSLDYVKQVKAVPDMTIEGRSKLCFDLHVALSTAVPIEDSVIQLRRKA